MQTKILNELGSILESFENYWIDGNLNKIKVIEDLRNYNVSLIEALLNSPQVCSDYVLEINGTKILKVEELINLLQLKNYWMNSFTKYLNNIGLSTENKYLNYNSDVNLSFPYKDCILEGAMTKEDREKKEIFWNKTIAKEEVDILLEPKVLSNPLKYTPNGVEKNFVFNEEDNLLIKGNNLISLHSINARYKGKIKLIYIDPPYNTGGDSFKYNDRFNHSTWLTFMKNRLEIAKELLSEDGTIWISIDDDEQAYLKVLCDEIYGRNNFVSNIIWEKRYSPTNDSKWLSDSHDFILVYAKNKDIWRPNLLPRTEKQNKYYKYDDGDGRGRWRSDNVLVKSFSQSGVFGIENPNTGEKYYPPKGSCYRFSKETALRLLNENRLYFGKNGKGAPQLKRYLSEVKQGVTPMTIWFRDEVTDNQEAKKEINNFKFDKKFDTPKPEHLLERIIHLATDEDDIVLDFFAGSGTTMAAALKMKRRFIGIEQMDYIESITLKRLKRVIEGEQGGISKKYSWSGGGSYIYTTIASMDNILHELSSSNDLRNLIKIYKDISDKSLIDYRVNEDLLEDNLEDMDIDVLRKIIYEILDVNQLYINFFEIEDRKYSFSPETVAFNNSFYQKILE